MVFGKTTELGQETIYHVIGILKSFSFNTEVTGLLQIPQDQFSNFMPFLVSHFLIGIEHFTVVSTN